MEFEEILRRWIDAEMEVASYRRCDAGCGRPEVDFLCAQLKTIADHWYALLLAEVGRVRRQLPRL